MNDAEFLDWCEANERTGLVLTPEQHARLHRLAFGHDRFACKKASKFTRTLGRLARHARKRIAEEMAAKLNPKPKAFVYHGSAISGRRAPSIVFDEYTKIVAKKADVLRQTFRELYPLPKSFFDLT